MNLSDAEARMLREALADVVSKLERSEEWWMTDPAKGGFDLDKTQAALAMLDAKAGEFKGSTPCDCRYGCCYHKDGPKGAGWYQTSDCPIHGEPSQGEGV